MPTTTPATMPPMTPPESLDLDFGPDPVGLFDGPPELADTDELAGGVELALGVELADVAEPPAVPVELGTACV
jgi:hypothetical protein